MSLTGDQKKHLLIGGGISALALVAGYMIFGRRKTSAAALPRGRTDELHDRRRRHHRHEQGHPSEVVEVENERGEYGRNRHHRERDRG
jgi:LPXTG-motif cell wall-anchored protein